MFSYAMTTTTTTTTRMRMSRPTSSMRMTVVLLFIAIFFFFVVIDIMVDSFMLGRISHSCSYSSSSPSSPCTTTTSSRRIIKSSRPMSSSSSSSSGGNNNNSGNNNENDNMMELLQEIPFLPKEVMSKFLTSIGGPLAAGNLQAGYQAGIISSDELKEIQIQLPDMISTTSDDNVQLQSIEYITQKWDEALVGQPWYIQKLGSLSSSTIVSLVAKLQQKTFTQVNAMKYINNEALLLIQDNIEVLNLLSIGDDDEVAVVNVKLKFNNTRAKYESDRKVWSASMDVFDERRMTCLVQEVEDNSASVASGSSSTSTSTSTSRSNDDDDALAALLFTEGMDEDENEKLKGNIGIKTVTVVEDYSNKNNNSINSDINNKNSININNNKIGLVNAYFIPDDEIKILVVEINDIMYNITWKGLP